MTRNEAKQAIDRGLPVIWSNDLYKCKRDNIGQYLIICTLNNYTTGLNENEGYKIDKAEMFRDWFNNFLTLERFAEYYGLSRGVAWAIIEQGRIEHEARCAR